MTTNPVIQAMLSWKSTKKYLDTPVPEDLLALIAEAGTHAPSGRNRQPNKIIIVTRKELRDKLSRLNAEILGASYDPFYGAPAVMVVLSRKDVSTAIYDGSLAMENMMLAARSLGLGACWIHRAKEVFSGEEGKAILAELGIEGEYEGIGHCIIGYPAPGSEHADLPRNPETIVWAK